MRARALITAFAVVLGSAAAVVFGAGPAAASGAAAGSYVALKQPSRLVDTRLGAGHHIHPELAGRGGLPTKGIGAVVATLTAYAPTAGGHLIAYPGRQPVTADLYFTKGQTASNTVVVGLNSGRLKIADVGHPGHVRVALDVTGYYRSGSSGAPGAFRPVPRARVVDTRHNTAGNRHGALHHGHGFTARIAGIRGVPGQSVGAVAVTVHVVSPTGSGTLRVGAQAAPRPSYPALHFRAGRAASAFAVVPLGAGTGIRIYDAAPHGSVQVLVDVAGYYVYGTAARAGLYEPLPSTARAARGTLDAAATRSVQVTGRGGIPRSHVAAAAVVLHASGTHGSLQVRRSGTHRRHAPVALTFAGRHTTSNVVIVPLSSRGRFALHSTSHHRASFAVDVVGYVPATTITAPPTFVGRYVRNLTPHHDGANVIKMRAEGAADAAAGSRLVLLHLGAQLNDRSGVLLSGTHRKIKWARLVHALDGYLTGYASTATAGGTIAIATNNDGNWRKYPAKARGRDWANKVIGALTVPHGVQVAGAADIEAGFVSTRAQAKTWEDAYLASTFRRLYFVGSADGCPATFGATDATCSFGWTEQQYYRLAHDGHRIRVLPQIYTPDNAVQWANIDATGGGGLIFAGALTEAAAAPDLSQQPAQGWAALYRALSSRAKAPDLPAVVDLRSDD